MPFLLADSDTEIDDEEGVKNYLNMWQQFKQNQPLKLWFADSDEWISWKKRKDPVLHIELRKVSDVLLIAPLSANTMAKFANGLADNLITNVFRAWNIQAESCIVAPAMNTYMYQNPITGLQIQVLSEKLKVKVLPTVEKNLMCGDVGLGAMQDVGYIVSSVKEMVQSKFQQTKLNGVRKRDLKATEKGNN